MLAHVKKNAYLCIVKKKGFFSCHEDDSFHQRIYVSNYSNFSIYAYLSMFHEPFLESRCAKGNWYLNIKPNGIDYERDRDTWESYFNCRQDTLFIHIADAQKVDVDDTTNLLVRYDLTWKDLILLDWHLSYPPTIEMKDMTMTPPFDSLFVSQ